MERVRTMRFLERAPLVQREARSVPVPYTPLRRTVLPRRADVLLESTAKARENAPKPSVPQKPKKERVLDKFFDWYFDRFAPTQQEINFYKAAGVKIFKFLVPNNGQLVNRIFKAPKLDTQSREALEKRIEQTKYGERMHMLWIPPILAAGIGLSVLFPLLSPVILLATAAVEVGVNGYPIMLQRYNRFLATEKLKSLPTHP